MSRPRSGLPVGALAMWLLAVPSAAVAAESAEETLRRSDVSSLAPESFRARLTISPARGRPQHIEVWRAGESKTLVRFLDPKDRGKYLLRLEDALYFLSPRARKPVTLSPAYRLGAASLDEMLGTRYARDYAVLGATETEDAGGRLVALELEARTPKAPWRRVRYVVRRDSHRPVRVEFRAPSGKTTGSVEFLEWQETPRPRPRRLRVDNALRPRDSADVAIDEVEERPAPPGLFDLEDPSARRRIEGGW